MLTAAVAGLGHACGTQRRDVCDSLRAHQGPPSPLTCTYGLPMLKLTIGRARPSPHADSHCPETYIGPDTGGVEGVQLDRGENCDNENMGQSDIVGVMQEV